MKSKLQKIGLADVPILAGRLKLRPFPFLPPSLSWNANIAIPQSVNPILSLDASVLVAETRRCCRMS